MAKQDLNHDSRDKALRQLGQRLPEFPVGDFLTAVARYADLKNSPPPPAKEVRDELDALADRAIELAGVISSASESSFRYLSATEQKFGAGGLRSWLVQDLRALMGIAEMARRDAELLAVAGRPLSARAHLVDDLAAILKEIGREVSARPQGDLRKPKEGAKHERPPAPGLAPHHSRAVAASHGRPIATPAAAREGWPNRCNLGTGNRCGTPNFMHAAPVQPAREQ